MEPKEIEQIEKNLPELIQKTKVTTALKTGLKTWNILTEEEVQLISAVCENRGDITAAKDLYTILMTRENGFNAIQKILLMDSQTEPLYLLNMDRDKINSLSPDLKTLLALELLQFSVQLLSQVKSLKETFPGMKLEDAEKILEAPDVMSEFQNLCGRESSKLLLHGVIPPKNPMYIERSVSDNVKIKSDVFGTDAPDKFVFITRTRDDIKVIIKKFHNAQSAESQIENKRITAKFMYMEQDDDWDDLDRICNLPMHLIRVDGKDFIYLRSNQHSQLLRQYIDTCRVPYVSEGELAGRIAEEKDNRGVCICDIPGMGKTWIQQSLARRLTEIGKGFSVYWTPLPTLSEYLATRDLDDECDHKRVLFDFICKSKLMACLLNKCVTKFNHRVVIFLDGFDELGANASDKMKAFLKNVQSGKNRITFCITSRPNMRKELEETFHVIAHDLLPFTQNDQVRAIVSHWKNEYPQHNEEKMQELASILITNSRKIQQNSDGDILGVPLKCYMVATIESRLAKRYSDPNRAAASLPSISNAASVKTICELYDTYIENGVKKLIKGMEKAEAIKKKNEIVNFHFMKALEIIFPKHSKTLCQELDLFGTAPILMNDAFKLGVVINKTDNETLEFIHRTFAEYFVAKLIVDYLVQRQNKPRNETIEHLLFLHILRPNVDRYDDKHNFLWSSLEREEHFRNVTLVRFIDGLLHSVELSSFLNELASSFFQTSSFLDWNAFLENTESRKLEALFMETKNVLEDIITNAENVVPLTDSMCMKTAESFVAMYVIDLFVIMECCLYFQFNTLLTLLAKIINTLPLKAKHLFGVLSGRFHLPQTFTKEFYSGACVKPSLLLWHNEVSRLWNKVGESGNIEVSTELYNLFETEKGNLLHLSREFLALQDTHPVEWAAVSCNTEAFSFLLDRFVTDDLIVLNNCILNPKFWIKRNKVSFLGDYKPLSESQVDKRKTILQYFLNERSNVLDTFKTELYHKLPRNTNTAILIFLKTEFSFQWKDINIFQKAKRLKHALYKESDREFTHLLLIFFHTRLSNKDTDADNVAISTMLNTDILEMIDIKEAQLALSLLQLSKEGTCFKYLVNSTTLKLLIELNVDFKETNILKRGLLHYSVWNGNLEWVRHLLENGFHVNEVDRNGETPIFFIGGPNILEMTKLLIERGSNIYAINDEEQTIAHILATKVYGKNSDDNNTLDDDLDTIGTDSDDFENEDEVTLNEITLEDFHNWAMLTLSYDLQKVWLMRDSEGDSPLHLIDAESQTAIEIVEKLLK